MSTPRRSASGGGATERGARDRATVGIPSPAQGSRRRWETSVAEWDRHLAGCPSCLSQGRGLCEFGEMLTDRAVLFREKWERTIRRAARQGFPLRGNPSLVRSPAVSGGA